MLGLLRANWHRPSLAAFPPRTIGASRRAASCSCVAPCPVRHHVRALGANLNGGMTMTPTRKLLLATAAGLLAATPAIAQTAGQSGPAAQGTTGTAPGTTTGTTPGATSPAGTPGTPGTTSQPGQMPSDNSPTGTSNSTPR